MVQIKIHKNDDSGERTSQNVTYRGAANWEPTENNAAVLHHRGFLVIMNVNLDFHLGDRIQIVSVSRPEYSDIRSSFGFISFLIELDILIN